MFKEEKPQKGDYRDHMANERTYLAWIRTSIGIMAFGFVIEKFTFFLKQITFLLGVSGTPEATHNLLQEHSSIFGIFIVGIGTIIGILSFIKYRRIEKQLEEGKYQKSPLLEIMLTLSILSVGIFLIIYLINSI